MRARGDSPDSASFNFERFRGGHCDCDTVLGKDLFEVPRNLKTAALRKKGWSDAKIKRAQEDSQKHAWVQRRGDGTTFKQDLAYWMKAIPETVHTQGWLGLLLFSDDAKEPCRFSRKQSVPHKQCPDRPALNDGRNFWLACSAWTCKRARIAAAP